jgi:hypothetical protein
VSSSTHQIAVKAQDKTAGAFASIQSRATAASARLRSVLGGALAAAGAYMGFRSVMDGINNLGHLSDVAQKTSTSVDELTRAGTALNILGIQNMNVEQLAKSFDYMQKTTGRSGMDGFYQTIREIGKIPDAAERGQAAMAIFGESGMQLMPLINAADKSANALKDVIDVMPGIPQSAADAGDDAADAMAIMSDNVKNIWQMGIGTIVGWFGKNYEGGIRTAALHASNSMILYAKIAVQTALQYYRKFSGFFEKVGGWVGTFAGTMMAGGGIGEAFKAANEDWRETAKAQDVVEEALEQRDRERRERWGAEWEERRAKIARFAKSYNRAVRTTRDRNLLDGEDPLAQDAVGKAKKFQNELVMGGSHRASQLAMMGPQMTNEIKKQTGILEKIRVNTQKTEEHVRDSGNSMDMEVLG